jgi:hypothetical protein
MSHWIGIDLDGTLAAFVRGKHEDDVIGEPNEEVITLVKTLLKEGHDVRIMTARAGNSKSVHAIEDWLEEHLGELLPITDKKDHYMAALLDDRVVNVNEPEYEDRLYEMIEEWETLKREMRWEEDEDD